MKMQTEKAHSKFSPSSSERWLNCPGSIALSENAPLPRESEYSKEGTDAHYCLEHFLKSKKPYTQKLFLAKSFPQEMVDHALRTFSIIEDMTPKDAIRLAETKVDLSHFIKPGEFGTVDCAIVEEFGLLTVIDFKYGAGIPVEVAENTQMICYALGISKMFNHNFSGIELVIIQPRAPHDDGPVRKWKLGLDELLRYEKIFRDAVKKCDDPLAELAAGPWCKFCPAAQQCPELSDEQFRKAQIVFDDSNPVPVLPAMPSHVEKLGRFLNAADLIELWIEKLRDHAYHLLSTGSKIEGWKLVNKRSTRKWIDEEKTTKEAVKKFGKKALTTPELLSPAQLEKMCKDAGDWISKRVSAESSGFTLVRESDKRPAIMPVEQVFTEIETKHLKKEIGNGKRKNGH